MEGAESELIVPSGHPAHQNPKAIQEVRRILVLNVGHIPREPSNRGSTARHGNYPGNRVLNMPTASQ
jgi:hypothetical protein